MPTYQYACTECDETLEVVQSFSDDALTVCPACEGRLRKVYSAVGIVFKGSGFYRTDSASRSTASSGAASGSSESGGGEKSAEKSSDGEKSSTPAKAESTSSSASSSSSSASSESSTKVA
ncbi:FmdB family zinc ribbon protein [Murinocardiopsis flavida]|uniref:FmdB family zinc ribbon protein n=1 Tax=Murinocardiopsis flavida TaxID=645275 RepID=UPI000D0D9E8F|nr:FmdB family zinc ribbon protein [Murinocardiopsis flavida]